METVWLIYIRKSVVRDETDLESPERQLFVCQTRLQLLGDGPYEVEIYEDLDKSGSSEQGRAEWLRLKEQLQRPEVAGVVASSLDRLYRNVSEFLDFLNELEHLNKALITAKESLDTTAPLGRFVVTILMALFEMEWRLTSHRMSEMIACKRQEQGRHWGPAPFGCERDENGQLIPSKKSYLIANNEARSVHDALTECFNIFATGKYTYKNTAEQLNRNNWHYLDRWGNTKPFTKHIVREILARWRIYRGDLPLSNIRKDKNAEWIVGGHNSILPIELCDTVGFQLERRNRPYKARRTNRVYLLSGLAHCATCKMKMVGQLDLGKYYYRHDVARKNCQERRINAAELERGVINALVEIVQHPSLLNDIQTSLNTLYSNQIDPADIQHKRDSEMKLTRLEDLYLEGKIAKERYLKRRNQILAELAEVDLRLQQPQLNDMKNIFDDLSDALHLIIEAEPKTQHQLLTTIFESVDVGEGKIKKDNAPGMGERFFLSMKNSVKSGPSGSRTHTRLQASGDFKSPASAIPPPAHSYFAGNITTNIRVSQSQGHIMKMAKYRLTYPDFF